MLIIKKYFKFLTLIILFLTNFFLFSNTFAKSYGEGEIKLHPETVNHFISYLKGGHDRSPGSFYVTTDGFGSSSWYCPAGGTNCEPGSVKQNILTCERYWQRPCKKFAERRTIVWRNGINPGKGKASRFNSKWSDREIRDKLEEFGFTGTLTAKKTTKKITKKEEKKKQKEVKKKIVKATKVKEERPIAFSWDGYSDLIAGTVEFKESNMKGVLKLPLPNNDGMCEGSYSLLKDGKGTWQISCTNNMGAAGTLKWIKGGSTTGIGRDFKDKKVKFTISQKG